MSNRPVEQTQIRGKHPHAVIANHCRPMDLFIARLARERRLHEYMIAKRKRSEAKRDTGTILARLKADFGYLGMLGERQAYMDELAEKPPVGKASQIERQNRMRAKKRNRPFELAFAKLPDKAPVETEIDWVRNHPAMARKARISKRSNTTGDTILIDEDDLLSPPHGACPSKCAANMLQNWVSQPERFFTSILAEQKKGLKGKTAEVDAEEEADEAIRDIDDIMSAMDGGSIDE